VEQLLWNRQRRGTQLPPSVEADMTLNGITKSRNEKRCLMFTRFTVPGVSPFLRNSSARYKCLSTCIGAIRKP